MRPLTGRFVACAVATFLVLGLAAPSLAQEPTPSPSPSESASPEPSPSQEPSPEPQASPSEAPSSSDQPSDENATSDGGSPESEPLGPPSPEAATESSSYTACEVWAAVLAGIELDEACPFAPDAVIATDSSSTSADLPTLCDIYYAVVNALLPLGIEITVPCPDPAIGPIPCCVDLPPDPIAFIFQLLTTASTPVPFFATLAVAGAESEVAGVDLPTLDIPELMTGKVCTFDLLAQVTINKPAFSVFVQESGFSQIRRLAGNCGFIDGVSASITISDHGRPPLSGTISTSGSASSAGAGPARAEAFQEVAMLTFPRGYHGPGSEVRARFKVGWVVNGRSRSRCAEAGWVAWPLLGFETAWGPCVL